MESTPNSVRAERTRTALLATAREQFAADGYAATSTPAIVEEARVSRGALYHHYRDKADLFKAVVEREYGSVAATIEQSAAAAMERTSDSVEILVAAGNAFLDAMRDPGRRRILLVDAPAVLGPETVREINDRQTGRTLRAGITAAVACGDFPELPVEAMADLLDAAYDRAALADDPEGYYRVALRALIEGLRVGNAENPAATGPA